MLENPRSANLRIAILFGGRSGEHEVSLDSAASVLEALKAGNRRLAPCRSQEAIPDAVKMPKYDLLPVYLDQQGTGEKVPGTAGEKVPGTDKR